MGERLQVEAVERLVGGVVIEDAARDWVYALRLLAREAGATPEDVVFGPKVAAWAASVAELVEALVDVEGGTDGLLAAEVLGINVQDALGRALAASAERAGGLVGLGGEWVDGDLYGAVIRASPGEREPGEVLGDEGLTAFGAVLPSDDAVAGE